MKHKITIIFFLIVFVFSNTICVSALNSHISDYENLLNENELYEVNKLAEEVGSKNGIDIQILTVESFSGYSIQDYADTYYENHAFGYGNENSGLLLVLSMSEGDWCISTQGSVLYMTDNLSYDFLDEISDGDYRDGFCEFIYAVDDAINNKKELKKSLIIGAVSGLIVSLITVLTMKSKMKTVKSNSYASDYIKDNSFELKESKDIFLFSNVTKTLRQTSSSSSGGGVHRSSSGTTHGGAHGKF